MASLKDIATTCSYLVGIGIFGWSIFQGLTNYLKIEPIPSILFSLMALLVIAVVIHNGEIKAIKERLDELVPKKKKGAIDIVTAIVIIVIILLFIYLSLQIRSGG